MNQGDLSGAMELLKKAKMLENGYTIDSKIESIKSIAKQDNSGMSGIGLYVFHRVHILILICRSHQ